MCNCIKDFKEQIKESLKDIPRNKDKKLEVFFKNANYVWSGESNSFLARPCTNFEVQRTYKNKSGVFTVKKEKVDVSFIYCPFCGERY